MTTSDNSGWMFGLFYVPLGLAMLIGTPMMLHAAYIIYSVCHHLPFVFEIATNFKFVAVMSVVAVVLSNLEIHLFFNVDHKPQCGRQES